MHGEMEQGWMWQCRQRGRAMSEMQGGRRGRKRGKCGRKRGKGRQRRRAMSKTWEKQARQSTRAGDVGNAGKAGKAENAGKCGKLGQGRKGRQRGRAMSEMRQRQATWVRQIRSNARKKETESPKAEGERSGVTWREETPKRE